jgi:hypothetical protein
MGHGRASPTPACRNTALRLRLRGPFRLAPEGYGKFLRRRTEPDDDTGIVTVADRRNLYFLINERDVVSVSPGACLCEATPLRGKGRGEGGGEGKFRIFHLSFE